MYPTIRPHDPDASAFLNTKYIWNLFTIIPPAPVVLGVRHASVTQPLIGCPTRIILGYNIDNNMSALYLHTFVVMI